MKRLVVILLLLLLSGMTAMPQKADKKSSGTASGKPSTTNPAADQKEKKTGAVAEVVHPKKVKEEVEQAFNEWKDAYVDGDKAKFLKGFAQVPDLVVRISQSEIIGYDNYLEAFEGREIPKTSQPFRQVTIHPIDEYAAFVTYLRSTSRPGEDGKPLAYRGTVIFAKTYSGWKVIAWHAHVVEDLPTDSPRD